MQEVKLSGAAANEKQRYLTKRWNLPARNINFTGRKDLLDQITERLSGSKPLVITACHGLGGVGKTQLVTEFAYRNEKKYERIIWIPSESADQIEAAYLLLGQDLQIIPDKTPPVQAIQIVKDWLTRHPRNLVIFDNAPDNKTVEGYGLSSGADILITSRNKDWEGGVAVDVFSSEEAVLYFRKVVGERAGDTKEKIEELAEEFSRLPLALAQAAAYIRQNKISIQAYLDLYQGKKAYLLSLSVLPESEHHAAVYVTWDITMERIKQESELAPALLNICSYLYSEKIPAFLLEPFCENEKYNPGKRETLEEARECLHNYSIVTVDEHGGSVSVHRLVQEVTQLKLSAEVMVEYLAVVYGLCMQCFPYGEERDQLEDLKTQRILLPHLSALLPKLEKEGESQRKVMDVLVKMSNAYFHLQDPRKERQVLEKALPLFKKCCGEKSLEFGEILSSLGRVIEGDEGCKSLMRAWDIEVAVYGSDQAPQLMIIENYLGTVYRDMRDIPKAVHYFRRALDFAKRLKKPAHVLAKHQSNLVSVYAELATPEEKQGFLQELTAIYTNLKANYGDRHPDVAKALNHLANAYGDLGDARKKYTLLVEALAIKKSFYQSPHREIVITAVDLSHACSVLENRSQRIQLLEEALMLCREYYGFDHPDAATVLDNLGCACGGATQVEHQEKALKIFEDSYGPCHPKVAGILTNLANAYGALGESDKKIALLKHAIEILKEVSSPEYQRILAKTLGSLASVYRAKRINAAQQILLLEKALEIKEQLYMRGHSEIAVTLHELAIVYYYLNRREAAQQFCSDALKIFSHDPSIGPHHTYTKNAAGALNEMERHSIELSTNLTQVIAAHITAIDSTDDITRLGSLHHNVACYYHMQCNSVLAEEHFQLATACGAVTSYCEYGIFLIKENRFEESKQNFLAVILSTAEEGKLTYDNIESVRLDDYLQYDVYEFGPLKVRSVILAYYFIIRCYQQLGEQAEYENYLSKFREAVEIFADPLCWRLLSYTYEYLGKTNEAEECREMLAAIKFSKQMTDAEAAGQFGLNPLSPRAVKKEKLAEAQEKLACKK